MLLVTTSDKIVGTLFSLMERSKILPPAALHTPKSLQIDAIWFSGLIGPGPGELPSHLAGLDGNERCGGGVTVHPAACQTASPASKAGSDVAAKPRS